MKKFFMYLPLAALLFAAACGDNDDDDVIVEPIIIEIPEYLNNSSDIVAENTTVRVYWFYEPKVLNSANCTESELKIELPGVLANKYLYKANANSVFDNYTVSDEKAMIGYVFFQVLMESNYYCWMRLFFDDYMGEVMLYYADRDVDIKGGHEYIEGVDYKGSTIRRYDLKLKKGWNKVALRRYQDSFWPYSSEPAYLYYSMDIPDDAYWVIY